MKNKGEVSIEDLIMITGCILWLIIHLLPSEVLENMIIRVKSGFEESKIVRVLAGTSEDSSEMADEHTDDPVPATSFKEIQDRISNMVLTEKKSI